MITEHTGGTCPCQTKTPIVYPFAYFTAHEPNAINVIQSLGVRKYFQRTLVAAPLTLWEIKLCFLHCSSSTCKQSRLWAQRRRGGAAWEKQRISPYCVWEGLREYFSTSGAESLHVGGARRIDKISNLKNDLSLRSIISQSSWLREQDMVTRLNVNMTCTNCMRGRACNWPTAIL